jgi:hypothetical protein
VTTIKGFQKLDFSVDSAVSSLSAITSHVRGLTEWNITQPPEPPKKRDSTPLVKTNTGTHIDIAQPMDVFAHEAITDHCPASTAREVGGDSDAQRASESLIRVLGLGAPAQGAQPHDELDDIDAYLRTSTRHGDGISPPGTPLAAPASQTGELSEQTFVAALRDALEIDDEELDLEGAQHGFDEIVEAELTALFHRCDADLSGELGPAEFVCALKLLNLDHYLTMHGGDHGTIHGPHGMRKLFADLDTRGVGSLREDEFIGLFRRLSAPNAPPLRQPIEPVVELMSTKPIEPPHKDAADDGPASSADPPSSAPAPPTPPSSPPPTPPSSPPPPPQTWPPPPHNSVIWDQPAELPPLRPRVLPAELPSVTLIIAVFDADTYSRDDLLATALVPLRPTGHVAGAPVPNEYEILIDEPLVHGNRSAGSHSAQCFPTAFSALF